MESVLENITMEQVDTSLVNRINSSQ